jgi:hypothetical protein
VFRVPLIRPLRLSQLKIPKRGHTLDDEMEGNIVRCVLKIRHEVVQMTLTVHLCH